MIRLSNKDLVKLIYIRKPFHKMGVVKYIPFAYLYEYSKIPWPNLTFKTLDFNIVFKANETINLSTKWFKRINDKIVFMKKEAK